MASKGKGKGNKTPRDESIKELVGRVDEYDLRAYVVDMARSNKEYERSLRAKFGLENAEQAILELTYITDTYLDKYEWDGFIGWQDMKSFKREYGAAVRAIVRPFLLRRDAESLTDLAIARFVQLQQICIDDSDGFYSDVLDEIGEQLTRAFKLADDGLRLRLFETLGSFLKDKPSEDLAAIYGSEQDLVRDFIGEHFAKDPAFAPRVIELAEQQLDASSDDASDENHLTEYESQQWAQLCLVAMVGRKDAPDEVRAYAEKHGLLERAGVVRSLADAYKAAGAPREAAAILRENLNAAEEYHEYHSAEPPRVLDCLEKIARECYDKAELAKLYRELLNQQWDGTYRSRFYQSDLIRWYDELHGATDDAAWASVRAELLEAAPYSTANALLSHEGSLDELYRHIAANEGKELLKYENVLSKAYPAVYVDYHLEQAATFMGASTNRSGYKKTAEQLKLAAKLAGGRERAEALARKYAAAYPKRMALLDELRKAGFGV